jgi:YbbR domain-containing protein
MKKTPLSSFIVFILFLSIFLFIYFNNNHLECIQKTETKHYPNGDIVTIKSHICNEKYNY